ncbi:hypothetical protein CSC82_01430 [Rhodobacteraceae bacterium 4F10]|nr:hypothetical protein CSC82_01430 [Rhodobacteraceae bacterium 4F10]
MGKTGLAKRPKNTPFGDKNTFQEQIMSGVQIFQHALRMLTGNLGEAVKVSIPLIATLLIVWIVGGEEFFAADATGTDVTSVNPIELLLSLVWAMAGLWTIVAWHRFVLLEEYPNPLPAFHGGRIVSYFLNSLMITILIAVPFGIALAIVGMLVPVLIVFVMIFALPVAVWAFYRLSPLLVAAALGEKMTLSEAWESTKEVSKSAVVAAILTFLVGAALQLAGVLVFAVVPFVGIFGVLAANWATSMVFASLVTTIYGVAVEKRNV